MTWSEASHRRTGKFIASVLLLVSLACFGGIIWFLRSEGPAGAPSGIEVLPGSFGSMARVMWGIIGFSSAAFFLFMAYMFYPTKIKVDRDEIEA